MTPDALFTPELLHALANLLIAWIAGSLIGLERTFNGRVAGFRTHGIVALAAAAVMLIARAPMIAPNAFPPHAAMFDPTRLAQGVMTGVGFLGAGVIFKEGVSVQGLTTAASIWATAAVGLLIGLGLPILGAMVAIAVLVSLTLFRWVEQHMPTRVYALGVFRFEACAAPDEQGLRDLLAAGVAVADVSHHLTAGGETFEYRANVAVRGDGALDALAQRLRAVSDLKEFELSRISK